MSQKHSRSSGTVATEVLRLIYTGLGTKAAAKSLEYLETGNWDQLVSLPLPEPSHYASARSFGDDYLVSLLTSKLTFCSTSYDREASALKKFFEAEDVCDSVNRMLSTSRAPTLHHHFGWRSELLAILSKASRKIAKALGPFSWDEAESHFGFGPGATNGVPSRRGDAYYKFGPRPTTTKNNLVAAAVAVARIPAWQSMLPDREYGKPDLRDESWSIVAGNKIVTVPKNAKTDRTIAAEPTMNGFIQRGIGAMIRHRLKRVGVNLDDQTRNQLLALEGSRDGDLVTIDLKAASDTVSLKLVERLLPADWWAAIEHCRSPRGVLPDGRVVTYQKVSSMGNAYTFELESLIFWAFSKVCVDSTCGGRGQIGVYGDDIVVPVAAARLLIDVLQAFGFTTNAEKTYLSGPFRESCGKHYFLGSDVTPFYLRDEPRTLAELISLANQIRLCALRFGRNGFSDSRFRPAYDYVVKLCKSKSRRALPRIPMGFGDGGLISSFDEAVPVWDRRLFSWRFNSYVSVSRKVEGEGVPFLLRSLIGLEKAGERRRVQASHPGMSVHDRHRYCTAYVTRWPDIAPWW